MNIWYKRETLNLYNKMLFATCIPVMTSKYFWFGIDTRTMSELTNKNLITSRGNYSLMTNLYLITCTNRKLNTYSYLLTNEILLSWTRPRLFAAKHELIRLLYGCIWSLNGHVGCINLFKLLTISTHFFSHYTTKKAIFCIGVTIYLFIHNFFVHPPLPISDP